MYADASGVETGPPWLQYIYIYVYKCVYKANLTVASLGGNFAISLAQYHRQSPDMFSEEICSLSGAPLPAGECLIRLRAGFKAFRTGFKDVLKHTFTLCNCFTYVMCVIIRINSNSGGI